MAMANILPDGPRHPPRGFNLLAWQGTALHKYLELRVQEAILSGAPEWWGVRTERKVSVGKVKGYGEVSGSIDVTSQDGIPTDYKFRYVRLIREWRRLGRPPSHMRTQVQVYGYGLELAGKAPEEVCLFIFPRDAMDPSEIWAYTEPYKRAIAKAAIKRAGKIFCEYVQTGRIDLLSRHRDCFNCSSFSKSNVVFTESPPE
jgi:hypothetical protein